MHRAVRNLRRLPLANPSRDIELGFSYYAMSATRRSPTCDATIFVWEDIATDSVEGWAADFDGKELWDALKEFAQRQNGAGKTSVTVRHSAGVARLSCGTRRVRIFAPQVKGTQADTAAAGDKGCWVTEADYQRITGASELERNASDLVLWHDRKGCLKAVSFSSEESAVKHTIKEHADGDNPIRIGSFSDFLLAWKAEPPLLGGEHAYSTEVRARSDRSVSILRGAWRFDLKQPEMAVVG